MQEIGKEISFYLRDIKNFDLSKKFNLNRNHDKQIISNDNKYFIAFDFNYDNFDDNLDYDFSLYNPILKKISHLNLLKKTKIFKNYGPPVCREIIEMLF